MLDQLLAAVAGRHQPGDQVGRDRAGPAGPTTIGSISSTWGPSRCTRARTGATTTRGTRRGRRLAGCRRQAPDGAQPPAHGLDAGADPLEGQGLPGREQLDLVVAQEGGQVVGQALGVGGGGDGHHDRRRATRGRARPAMAMARAGSGTDSTAEARPRTRVSPGSSCSRGGSGRRSVMGRAPGAGARTVPALRRSGPALAQAGRGRRWSEALPPEPSPTSAGRGVTGPRRRRRGARRRCSAAWPWCGVAAAAPRTAASAGPAGRPLGRPPPALRRRPRPGGSSTTAERRPGGVAAQPSAAMPTGGGGRVHLPGAGGPCPVALAWAPDRRLFIAERGGTIEVADGTQVHDLHHRARP